ncbi:MAG: TusE/DsrC/DsvC family sulfur relay protein [Desulfobacterales bacterium]|jgi:tRNA 2-thiouridine synthesizing protein E|nr:TusE/DsrC/DsvC family sulfur relay protein [Desulfobacterales bacterium]
MNAPPPEEEKPQARRVRTIAGQAIAFDDEGFFEDFKSWSEAVFEVLAHESGMAVVTDRHRQVVRFLRDFYAYNGRAPLNNQLRQGTGMRLLELEGLFPEGLKQGARRLAGLPNPKTCN